MRFLTSARVGIAGCIGSLGSVGSKQISLSTDTPALESDLCKKQDSQITSELQVCLEGVCGVARP